MINYIIIGILILIVGGAIYLHHRNANDNKGEKMGVGIEVYDTSGNAILNTSMLTTEYLGERNTGGASSGSFTDANINNRTVWICPLGTKNNSYWDCPKFTQSGNTVTWSYPSSTGEISNIYFIYGVF